MNTEQTNRNIFAYIKTFVIIMIGSIAVITFWIPIIFIIVIIIVLNFIIVIIIIIIISINIIIIIIIIIILIIPLVAKVSKGNLTEKRA